MDNSGNMVPYIKNQLANGRFDLGNTLVWVMWTMIIVAIVMAVVACVIGFIKKHHEVVDGQKKETFSDRWSWIPLVCMGAFLGAGMVITIMFFKL